MGERTNKLMKELGEWDVEKLSQHLSHAGIIPEMYDHDSSEEKLYAKYCDILLFAFFKLYGMKSELVKERGDSPDVIGTNQNQYKIVADAKAFRLSRTALNPKDYKIDPVNQWRVNEEADYACLVTSFFPGERSRLFQEAVDRHVTLLTYPQLQFIISDPKWTKLDLRDLWGISATLTSKNEISPGDYKNAIETWLLKNVASPIRLKEIERKYYINISDEGEIAYLESEKQRIKSLSRKDLEDKLLYPIDMKIAQIRSRIAKLLNEINDPQGIDKFT